MTEWSPPTTSRTWPTSSRCASSRRRSSSNREPRGRRRRRGWRVLEQAGGRRILCPSLENGGRGSVLAFVICKERFHCCGELSKFRRDGVGLPRVARITDMKQDVNSHTIQHSGTSHSGRCTTMDIRSPMFLAGVSDMAGNGPRVSRFPDGRAFQPRRRMDRE